MRLVSLPSTIMLLSTWTLLKVLSTIITVVAVALPPADGQPSSSSPSLTLPASATDIATTPVHVPTPNFNPTDLDALVQTATSSAYGRGSCGLLRMDDGIYYDLIGDKTCQRSPRPISGSAIIDSGCTCIFYRLAPYCVPASAFMWVDGPSRWRIDGSWMSEWYWCAHMSAK